MPTSSSRPRRWSTAWVIATGNVTHFGRTPADPAALAVMWNESDDQWPGTFTGGVPFTEERVRDWLDKKTCLMRLVVENGTDGSIVGYGSLRKDPGREGTCYVDMLNVHPAHQKRSLARRMLTRMVDWATAHGYRRMTIETWPGNLKSVPLYKKVGFFWAPDTDVHMENYVPRIRQLALAQKFFERHDWYTAFRVARFSSARPGLPPRTQSPPAAGGFRLTISATRVSWLGSVKPAL